MRNTRILALLLAVTLLLSTLPASAAIGGTRSFSDVKSDDWFKPYVDKLSSWGIINGYEDGSFGPNRTLTRAEFITMVFNAGNTLTMMYIDENDQPGSYETINNVHWAQPYWNALNDAGIIAGSGIKCSNAELNQPITRNEMAVLITNMLYKDYYEDKVSVSNVTGVIKDYNSIPSGYRYYVEQAFGKGVLSGYTDQTFQGGNQLTRGEAASVVDRMLFAQDRKVISAATSVKPTTTPAALEWQKKGWINAYGTASAELRQILFGDANKSGFRSANEAAAYMETVTIPIWKMDKGGNKYADETTVVVNKAVAADVKAIFQQIFDDPEQFPIQSVGGARYSDTMRHSWGCAIDINPTYNAECRANYNTNTVSFTSGFYGWWPLGTSQSIFSGQVSAPSAYSIKADGSVVKAFSDYGWGWGGQGYSVRSDNTQKFDYMHFSVMQSGG